MIENAEIICIFYVKTFVRGIINIGEVYGKNNHAY